MNTNISKTGFAPIPIIDGIAEFAARFDGLILDLWGVVHNGRAPFPAAIDCMRNLRARDKAILLLSNAPRRVAEVRAFLDKIGVPRDCYDQVLTSGELTRDALAEGRAGVPGQRFYRLGPERDWGLLAGLDFRVAEISDADFILCTGLFDDERETAADYARLFDDAVARGLPLICANPDLSVIRGGQSIPCAGSLAAAYEARGGRTIAFGKPHAATYASALALLGLEKRAVLAVGDSLRTDIAGAAAAGIASILVTGGIHADEWGLKPGQAPDPSAVAAAAIRERARPDAAMTELRW